MQNLALPPNHTSPPNSPFYTSIPDPHPLISFSLWVEDRGEMLSRDGALPLEERAFDLRFGGR